MDAKDQCHQEMSLYVRRKTQVAIVLSVRAPCSNSNFGVVLIICLVQDISWTLLLCSEMMNYF